MRLPSPYLHCPVFCLKTYPLWNIEKKQGHVGLLDGFDFRLSTMDHKALEKRA